MLKREYVLKLFINFNRIDISIDSEHLLMGKNLVASTAFFYDRLTWCVQKRKPIPTSEIIFYLCNDPVVYALFTSLAFFVIFMSYFAQMFEPPPRWDWFKITINAFECCMSLPCTYNPTNNAHRIGTISAYFGSWLFAALLNTIIIKLFTTPIFNPQLKTVDQLIEDKFSLAGNAFTYQIITEQNQVF